MIWPGKTCVNELNLDSWDAVMISLMPGFSQDSQENYDYRIIGLGSSFSLIRFVPPLFGGLFSE